MKQCKRMAVYRRNLKGTVPMLSKIGIRPVIDGRQFGIRESLEVQTMNMAKAAAELISSKVRHASGEPMECVIADTTIGGIAESAACADKFATENIVATPHGNTCWCYVTQVIDENPNTIKAVWGSTGPSAPARCPRSGELRIRADRHALFLHLRARRKGRRRYCYTLRR